MVVGAALFVLSDTLFGDTDAAAYSAFFGLIMFPGGLILVLVGIVQVIVVRIKDRQK
jgi:predicted phage tail protein